MAITGRVQGKVARVTGAAGLIIEPELRVVPLPGSRLGTAADPALRIATTGPDEVHRRDGMRRMAATR